MLRGLSKAELARRAGMPAQTLQRIEDGSTKSVSLAARRMLAPVLQVREDQLMLPIGLPVDPLPGQEPPINDLILQACQDILRELRELNLLLRQRLKPPPV